MQDPDDDVVIEEDEAAPEEKVKKLRAKLTKVTSEKQEYLDGWQRTQADFVNMKREFTERLSRANEEGKIALLLPLLPSFDAFEAALERGESGSSSEVLKGFRNIHRTLLGALAKEGLEPFSGEGEAFDPRKHLSVQVETTSEKKKDHTIAKVLQRGWRQGEKIIRPATVSIYQLEA